MKKFLLLFLSIFVLMLFITARNPLAFFKVGSRSFRNIPAWPAKSRRPRWKFTPEPTTTPRPIAQGSQTYLVSRGGGLEGPQMSKFIINPHDPQIGEQQIMRVCIVRGSATLETRVLLQTDNTSKRYQFSLVEDTDTDECEGEWWEGSWETEDTHDVNYVATFEAVNNEGVSRADLSIR